MCPAVSTLISLTNRLSVSSKYDPNITLCPVFQNDCRLIVGWKTPVSGDVFGIEGLFLCLTACFLAHTFK